MSNYWTHYVLNTTESLNEIIDALIEFKVTRSEDVPSEIIPTLVDLFFKDYVKGESYLEYMSTDSEDPMCRLALGHLTKSEQYMLYKELFDYNQETIDNIFEERDNHKYQEMLESVREYNPNYKSEHQIYVQEVIDAGQ